MNKTPAAFIPPITAQRVSAPARLAVLGLVLGLAAAPVLAQGVYRIVGPDGRVTYSDQPPPAQANARPVDTAATTTAASANAQLPFELRQVVGRFPVTLYTSASCAPCNSGRNLLNSRGIPYVEKTINTAQDADALKRLSGDVSLPFLTIGSQQIKGYAEPEWTQFLNAAGYPKQSVLPSNYRRAPASPLVAVVVAEPAVKPPAAVNSNKAPAAKPIPVTPPSNNPAGIRF